MNKTNNMSIRVFPVPVQALLDSLGPWRIEMMGGADPEFSFEFGPSARKPANANGAYLETIRCEVSEVRQRVFALRRPEDAVELFQDFGPWYSEAKDVGRSIRFSEVLERRDFYESALLKGHFVDPSSEDREDLEDFLEDLNSLYLSEPLSMSLHFGEPPHGLVQCRDIEDALRTSVFLEKLDRTGWRRCKRKDCGSIFKLTSKRERLYCSTDCAHLQSVRSYNERKATRAKYGIEKEAS